MASAAVVALCSVASPALAANYPTSAYYRPFVEAGPGGHAVAVAGFDTPGAAFAPPGGAFGAASGSAPPGPDALALDATGTGTALDSNGKEVQAFVAPPGGPFGAAMSLGPSGGTQSLLAVDPQGAAAAAWGQEGRLRVAVRPAGGSFAPAVDGGPASRVAGVTIAPDGTVQVLVSRPREPAPSSSPTDAVLVTIRPGATGADAVALAGEEGLALARSPDGQLLVIMRAVVDSAVRLVSQRVDAAGRPTSAVRPVAGRESGYVEVLGAVLEPDGRALVAWTVPDGRSFPIRVLVAEGNAATGFAAPRRLDREGELSGAQLAANARGYAAIVWSSGGYRPRAALRPAGGTFGAPLIVSPRAGYPPTVGVLPDGQAVVGWTEDDGLASRQVVARVTRGGAGPPQVLAERTLRLRPRQRARCRAARRSVLARNRFAVYRRVGRGSRREVCSLITGVTEPVYERQFGDFLDSVRLAGPLVARATVTGEDVGPDQYAEAAVFVGDTRTGRSPGPLGIDLGENVAVGDLVLTADGAYAVTVCSTGADLYYVSHPTRLARRLCSRPGRRVQVIAVDSIGPGRDRVVGRGRTIDPRSLRLRGRRVTWRQNGRKRSATLRQVRLPG